VYQTDIGLYVFELPAAENQKKRAFAARSSAETERRVGDERD
jgi:hypothetical protein